MPTPYELAVSQRNANLQDWQKGWQASQAPTNPSASGGNFETMSPQEQISMFKYQGYNSPIGQWLRTKYGVGGLNNMIQQYSPGGTSYNKQQDDASYGQFGQTNTNPIGYKPGVPPVTQPPVPQISEGGLPSAYPISQGVSASTPYTPPVSTIWGSPSMSPITSGVGPRAYNPAMDTGAAPNLGLSSTPGHMNIAGGTPAVSQYRYRTNPRYFSKG